MTLLFISGIEIFFILLIVLLLFGAKKIPEFARGLGKGIKEVKNVTNELKKELEDTDVVKDINDIKKNIDDTKVAKDVKDIKKDIDNSLS